MEGRAMRMGMHKCALRWNEVRGGGVILQLGGHGGGIYMSKICGTKATMPLELERKGAVTWPRKAAMVSLWLKAIQSGRIFSHFQSTNCNGHIVP